ncbi:energy transducer TonB [Pseudomonas sp. Irchel s3h17]|nr:energy transducer TonB [Pseudomonas sp. Irchel s3h17]
MPKPKYPPERVNETGKVRVSLNIHNDGSISDMKVLRASREALGDG